MAKFFSESQYNQFKNNLKRTTVPDPANNPILRWGDHKLIIRQGYCLDNNFFPYYQDWERTADVVHCGDTISASASTTYGYKSGGYIYQNDSMIESSDTTIRHGYASTDFFYVGNQTPVYYLDVVPLTEAFTNANFYNMLDDEITPTKNSYGTTMRSSTLPIPAENLSDYVFVKNVSLLAGDLTVDAERAIIKANNAEPMQQINFKKIVNANGEIEGNAFYFSSMYKTIIYTPAYINRNVASISRDWTDVFYQYNDFFYDTMNGIFEIDDRRLLGTGANAAVNSGASGYYMIIAIKRDALIKYLNYCGQPWTFDLNEAKTMAVEDFSTGYDPNPNTPLQPGQSNNTSSDWTGAGDNNEDSFTQTVPHFSPYGSVVNQYAMSGLQVQQFIRELFEGSFITNPDLIKNDPKEGLVSCRYYPFNVRFHDSAGIGNDENIVVGGVQMEYSSGAKILPNYNQILDLGEFKVDEYFGGFLDYQLTTIDVYLPYVGWQQMPANALMGRTLKIKYIVDIISGDCSCLLTTTDGRIERFENIFSGHMGIDIPILTSNHNENTKQAASSVLSAITAVGGAVATYATGGIGGLAAAGISAAAITNSATDIATMQNHANMGTPISSSSALWMPQDIIFRITRPRKSEATEFKNRWGYRANFSTKLSATSGFTQVDNPKLDFACDESERGEIKQLLQGGIYL